MDISRQQFEAMAIKRGLSIDKKKDEWGQEKYKYDMIQIMWEGWQASRDALKPVGYTSHKELQEMTCSIVGIVHRNKNVVNYIPVYIND
ncbi:TPA: hypothetical protein OOF53_002932 [Morganella morganii]|nr:hypothetical protein [Morganella morganii]